MTRMRFMHPSFVDELFAYYRVSPEPVSGLDLRAG